MAPIIGITTKVNDEDRLYSVSMDYVGAVERAGGIPVLIPPTGGGAANAANRIDGLLLTGGPDVDPKLYGGAMHEAVYGVNPTRDLAEIALLHAAMKLEMPVLGICRGAQLINVALGGTLIEHLPEQGDGVRHRAGETSGTRHRVDVRPGTILSAVLGRDVVEPVSFHHQAVKKPADGLDVAATAPDGVVEGFSMPGYPFLIAVQWHPEMTAADDRSQQAIFDAFIRAAARFAGTRRKNPVTLDAGARVSF